MAVTQTIVVAVTSDKGRFVDKSRTLVSSMSVEDYVSQFITERGIDPTTIRNWEARVDYHEVTKEEED